MVIGFIKQWWHTLIGMLTGHQSFTIHSVKSKPILLACICGKIFWSDKNEMIKDWY